MREELIVIPGELPDLNQIINKSKRSWAEYNRMKKDSTYLISLLTRGVKSFEKVDLDITWHCKNKRKDKDNIMAGGIKMILDGLVKAKVIKNDGWSEIGDISNSFKVDKKNPRIEVKIRESK